jgi:hypothetical protein
MVVNGLVMSIDDYIANSPYSDYIAQTEQQYGIPSGLLGGVLYAESTLGKYGSQGNGGGIGQFIPSTARQYGVDTSNDYSGISGAGRYLSSLYSRSGSWLSSVQGYGTLPTDVSGGLNAGQQHVYGLAHAADGGTSGTSNDVYDGSLNPRPGEQVNQNSSSGIVSKVEQFFFNYMSSIALRIFAFILGAIFLVIGIAALAFGSSPKQTVITISKALLK